MFASKTTALTLTWLCLLCPTLLNGQSLEMQRLLTGLSQPLVATYAPGDSTRLYIAERSGTIKVVDLNTNAVTNFMTVPGVDTSFEGGLLGLAFHPEFATNKFFYVNYTEWTGVDRTRIVRYTATDADSADSATAQTVMEFNQPEQNHNGGWIGFSPIDGYLYIATGDGGGANDAHGAIGNGQNLNTLLGKILRIDIDGDDFPGDDLKNYANPDDNPFVDVAGLDEIFLYGIRNPWRCSFDRLTGDLYIGDVGQNLREEISFFPAAGYPDRNMGWRLREGVFQTPGVGGPRPADNIDPIYDYPRTGLFGGTSVTGGYVYRGPIGGLQGNYFFMDHNSNNLWSIRFDGSDPADFNGQNYSARFRWNNAVTVDAGSISSVAGFGEDADGNLYLLDRIGGELFKVVGGFLFDDAVLVPPIIPYAGILESGSIDDLNDSDDVAVKFRSVAGTPNIQLGFRGSMPTSDPQELIFNMESRTTSPNVIQTIEVFNYVTNMFEVFDKRLASTTDAQISIEIDNATDYVGATGNVETRVTWDANGPVTHFPWAAVIDQVGWQFIE